MDYHQRPIPDHCKGCVRLSAHKGIYGPWCTYFGRQAPKAVGECKLKGKRKPIPFIDSPEAI